MPSKTSKTTSRNSSSKYVDDDDDDDLSFFGAGRGGTGGNDGSRRTRERVASGGKYGREQRLGSPEHDDAHHAHHRPGLNLTGLKYKKLSSLLRDKKKELNQKIQAEDNELSNSEVKGHNIFKKLEALKNKCNNDIKLCQEEWLKKHSKEYADIERARKDTKGGAKQPHSGIRMRRNENLHSHRAVYPTIKALTEEVNDFISEHGLLDEDARMSNPMPKHAGNGGNEEYHIIPMRHYISRLKFQLIESMVNIIQKTAHADRNDTQAKILAHTHTISQIKEELTEIYKARKALAKPRAREGHMTHEAAAFADRNDLPPQVHRS